MVVRDEDYEAEVRGEKVGFIALVYTAFSDGVFPGGGASKEGGHEGVVCGAVVVEGEWGERLRWGPRIIGAGWRVVAGRLCSAVVFFSDVLYNLRGIDFCRVSGTTCAISIKCRESPIPSASITSNGTITPVIATSIRLASCRSVRVLSSGCRTTAHALDRSARARNRSLEATPSPGGHGQGSQVTLPVAEIGRLRELGFLVDDDKTILRDGLCERVDA